MRSLARRAVALWGLAGLAAASSLGATERPFSVALMMQTEEIGEASFAPDGQRLLIEKLAAYETSQNFGWTRSWGRERSKLLDVELSGATRARATDIDDTEHLWLGSYSPSGARAAVGWFDGDQLKAGVYDFHTRTLRKFPFLISSSTCAFDCPYWISEDEFVHFTVSADEQKKELSDIAYSHEMIDRWSHETWKGTKAAVKVLGSGRYQSKAIEEGGRLIRVNVRSGETALVDEGLFRDMEFAPDHRRLAVLRETGNLEMAGIEARGITGADKVFELTVYDFAKGGAKLSPCAGCNVTRSSLRWSPSGAKLFFAARVIQEGKQAHQYYIYDFRRGQLTRFVAPEVRPGVRFTTEEDLRDAGFVTPFLWMTDDTPAIRISGKRPDTASREAEANEEGIRYDWYALRPGRPPVQLTAGLNPVLDKKPLENPVAAYDGQLLMMVDGSLWSLGADGRRRNLTEALAVPVSPWCSVIAYWRDAGVRPVCTALRKDLSIRPINGEALKQGWITLRTVRDVRDDVSASDVVFLNIKTGQHARIHRTDPTEDLVSASALAKSAIYRRKGTDGDRLLLTRAGGESDEVLYFNRQLSGVVGGTPVMLTRREAGEKEDRIDWLLLPPNHQPGDRHPLLVYFYPDKEYSKDWHSDDLRSVSFVNQHIPAARGYAVLLASMRISAMGKSGDPMLEMHEQLIHAAENVVRAGYVDPQRWALMGHSYGGYGTNCVITQTARFKAAISMDGPANLTSGYAIGLAAEKATAVAAGLSFGALWSEGGQGRMGVPPWKDPQRYIRNSPLFSADKIQTPLLLIHGDDDFVNVNEAEQMFNALHRQGKEALFLRYWGEGHVYGSPANIADMWQRIFAWLDDHLDVARDASGSIVYVDHHVKSRAGAPALRPEDFARLDRL